MSKSARYLLTGCIAVIFLIGAFSGGVLVGWFLPKDIVSAASPFQRPAVAEREPTEEAAEAATPQNKDELFAPFWEAWDIVKEQYVDQPVDEKAMMRGAISGMLEALGDQHTSYMDPDEFQQANMPMSGEYDGIGAYVDTDTEYMTIVSPMPGSPAEKAGLKPGDKIIKVDGEDMTGIPGSLVLRRVLGPAGTDVTLTIAREDMDEPFDVTITRAKITLKSVESKMLEDNIAYIKLNTFGEKTTTELKQALKEMMDQKPAGMILDLRNNGGGYVDTAVDVVSQFVSEGVVVIERYGDGSEETIDVKRGGLATDIPLVVLVNEGSASASEITAGAIQDYGRGKLVGVTTYGKGSMQYWIPLENNEGAVRVTIGRWLTPNERQIDKKGLEPDVVVELTEEDFTAGRDPQLDKAVEVLKQGL